MSTPPVEAVAALARSGGVEAAPAAVGAAGARAPAQSFGRLLLDGLQQVDQTVQHADQMTRAFAVDDSVPLHQVTFALEQARLSVELMNQVRSRLVEGYQDLFRMQL